MGKTVVMFKGKNGPYLEIVMEKKWQHRDLMGQIVKMVVLMVKNGESIGDCAIGKDCTVGLLDND